MCLTKIIWAFAVDPTATQTAHLLRFDRNPVNQYYGLFNGIDRVYIRRLCGRGAKNF